MPVQYWSGSGDWNFKLKNFNIKMIILKDEIRKQEPGFNAICNTCDLKLKLKCEANCLENIIWLYQYRIWQGQCNERIIILVAHKDHCHCFNWSSNERKEIKLWILYLFKIYILSVYMVSNKVYQTYLT